MRRTVRRSCRSANLDGALHAMEDRPWSDYRGRPLTDTMRGRWLRGFGVKSDKDRGVRGYFRAAVETAWKRYGAPLEPVQPVKPVQSTVNVDGPLDGSDGLDGLNDPPELFPAGALDGDPPAPKNDAGGGTAMPEDPERPAAPVDTAADPGGPDRNAAPVPAAPVETETTCTRCRAAPRKGGDVYCHRCRALHNGADPPAPPGTFAGILPAAPREAGDECPRCEGVDDTCMHCRPHAVYLDRDRPLPAGELVAAEEFMRRLRERAS